MLDIFLAFFVLLGVWLLLEDRARAPGWTGLRSWRIGSGVAFGLAIASKWGAVPMLPVVAAVALAWEVARIHDARDAAAPKQADGRVGVEGSSSDPNKNPGAADDPSTPTPA